MNLEHELKFVLPAGRLGPVSAWLRRICRADPRYPDGIVCSIYYDTLQRELLREKVDSQYLKTKIRIRWYEDPETRRTSDKAFAEAKYRIGSRRRKLRVEIPMKPSRLARFRLTASELVGLPRALSTKGVVFDRPVLPLLGVTYRRLRFVEPFTGARIALDSSIRRSSAHPRLGTGRPEAPLSVAVLEIKSGSTRVPRALRSVTALGRRASFSKYAQCAGQDAA